MPRALGLNVFSLVHPYKFHNLSEAFSQKNLDLYLVCILGPISQCLKITEKVSFNIASEASYVNILSGQKLIKNAKTGPFWRVFENLKLAVKQCYQTGQF